MSFPTLLRTARRHIAKSTLAQDHTYERAKNIATIVSAIAIPIVISISGYFIQKQISDDGLKKDYVGIAASILKEDAKKQEPDLRSWAVKILEENSPVPFSKKARDGLILGTASAGLPWFGPPASCRRTPAQRTILADLAKLDKKIRLERKAGALTESQAIKHLGDFVQLVVNQEQGALENIADLECLHSWTDSQEQVDIDYRKEIGAPSSKSILEKFAKEPHDADEASKATSASVTNAAPAKSSP